MRKYPEIAYGTKFGRWTVVGHWDADEYLCKCECGTKAVRTVSALRRGTKSCGCAKRTPEPAADQQFGKLIFTGEVVKKQTKHAVVERYVCVCTCENKTRVEVAKFGLTSGKTKSCGCLAKNRPPSLRAKHPGAYNSWSNMISRCYCETHPSRKYYADKGIVVCDRWRHSFDNFLQDMGDRPKGKTLHRTDNDKDYTPENCIWATPRVQAKERSGTVLLTHDGETECVSEWSRRTGLPNSTIKHRMGKGLTSDEVLAPPTLQELTHNNRTMPVTDWAKEYGISYNLLYERLEAGWDAEVALTSPSGSRRNGTAREVRLTFNGETHSISGWAKKLGILSTTLGERLKTGWSVERALTTKDGRKFG